MSDNFNITIRSSGKKHFDMAFEISFDNAPGGKAKYYTIHKEHGFILFWSKPEDNQNGQLLPYEMDMESAKDFVWNWLKGAEYPETPDHDGDNSKGFLITTGDFWGHINNSFYSIVAINPYYMMHGK